VRLSLVRIAENAPSFKYKTTGNSRITMARFWQSRYAIKGRPDPISAFAGFIPPSGAGVGIVRLGADRGVDASPSCRHHYGVAP
jgi:hypothetical protein